MTVCCFLDIKLQSYSPVYDLSVSHISIYFSAFLFSCSLFSLSLISINLSFSHINFICNLNTCSHLLITSASRYKLPGLTQSLSPSCVNHVSSQSWFLSNLLILCFLYLYGIPMELNLPACLSPACLHS